MSCCLRRTTMHILIIATPQQRWTLVLIALSAALGTFASDFVTYLIGL